MFERPKRRVPLLNTTATADISFMLLIFFLVTSSMDTDKGLPRQLPPPQESQTEVEMKIKERNALEIELNGQNETFCQGEKVSEEVLLDKIKTFVANKANAPTLPEKSVREVNYFGRCAVSDRHVLVLKISRDSNYDSYFHLQNTIARAYAQLRNELARKKFHKPFIECSNDEREAIGMVYPQRISERVESREE